MVPYALLALVSACSAGGSNEAKAGEDAAVAEPRVLKLWNEASTRLEGEPLGVDDVVLCRVSVDHEELSAEQREQLDGLEASPTTPASATWTATGKR